MSTETNFNIHWLEERFSFDSKARNAQVEQSCLDFFQRKDHLHIVDIGSGTGSNCLYFMEKFPQNQSWTFVELNKELLATSFNRIQNWARLQGWKTTLEGKQLVLKIGPKQIQISGLNASFLELEKLLDLENIDLVTAGAVFDLLTSQMFTQFGHQLLKNSVALLATINYVGMRFEPSDPNDLGYINFYGEHMQRLQSFGRSMGPDCFFEMKGFSEDQNLEWESGKSDWEIGPEATTMHQFLLDYMEGAITELLYNQADKQHFIQWLSKKKQLVRDKKLNTTVFHHDIFIKPLWQSQEMPSLFRC